MWSWSVRTDPKNFRTVYILHYEIQNEDKFKIFSPDSVEWSRLRKCAKVMTQTDKKNHTYVVMEAEVRKCGLYTTIVDETNGYLNVIPNGTVYYNIISGDLDATATAMQILKDDYVPLTIEQIQYIGRCKFDVAGNSHRVSTIEGTIQQVSNWADNIIRTCGECEIRVELKG